MRSYQSKNPANESELYVRNKHKHPGLTWENRLRDNNQLVSELISNVNSAAKLLIQIQATEPAVNHGAYFVVKSRYFPGYRVAVNLDNLTMQPAKQADVRQQLESLSLTKPLEAKEKEVKEVKEEKSKQPSKPTSDVGIYGANLFAMPKTSESSSFMSLSSSSSSSSSLDAGDGVKLPTLK